MTPLRLLILGLMLIGPSLSAVADDPPKPPTARTVAQADVPREELELVLKPLTRAELMVEADGWQKLLQAKLTEISENELATLREKDAAARSKQIDAKSKLMEEKTQIIDRLNVVLSSLRAKGGKSDDYDTYVNAVSGVSMRVSDVTNAGATAALVMNWLKSPEGGIRYGKNIALFLVTLVVFRVLTGIVGGVLSRALQAVRTMSKLLRDFVVNVTRKLVMFVGFVIALSMLEVNIGPFLAVMGAAGFVIGFALQGTLSNFAAGVMILLYRPYDIGDKVTLAGVTGLVESMTLVSTIVRNADGHVVVIPNSAIWGGTITNLSAPAGTRA